MSNVYQVQCLIAACLRMGLSMPPEMRQASTSEIIDSWNGIGSEDTPKAVRKFLGLALHEFAPAALIHDYEYSMIERLAEPQGQEVVEPLRELADDRFYRNCKTCARDAAAIWNPRRAVLLYHAFLAWRTVRRLGKIA
jgi:hypothetical protein